MTRRNPSRGFFDLPVPTNGVYVVVEAPGTDNQIEVADFPRFRDAARYVAEWYSPDERDDRTVDIMKRLKDGSLTTEF